MAVRKIETEISLSGEKEFNDQMKSVNNNLKNLNAELNASSAAMSSQGSSLELLTSRQRLLDEQVEQQREKIRALNEMYKKSVEAKGKDSAAADKYRQQLANATAALSRMEKAQKENNEALEKAKPSWRDAAAAVKEFTENHERGLKAMGAVAKGAGMLTAAGGAAAGALALLTAVGLKGLTDAAIEAAQNGDPAFAGLAANLESLEGAAASAKGALASVLLPSLESLSGEGAKWLSDFSTAMRATNGDSAAMKDVMSQYIKSGVEILRNGMPQLIESGKDLFGAIVQGGVENLPELLSLTEELVSTLLDGLEENADLLAEGAVMLVTELGLYMLENAPELLSVGMSMISTFVEGIAAAMPELLPAALQTVLAFGAALIAEAPNLAAAGLEMIWAIVEGFLGGTPLLNSNTSVMVDELKAGILENAANLGQIGRDIISYVFAGIQAAWEGVVQWWQMSTQRLNTMAIDALPGAAVGINYVPYDNYAVRLHEGEMVVPKRLATQLRSAGIRKDSDLSDGIGGGASVTNNFYPRTMTQAEMEYFADLVDRIIGGG